MKKTKTRILLEKTLKEAKSSYTAFELFEIHRKDNLTLSTIYRTLQTFEKEGLVTKEVSTFKNEAVYYWKHEDHHEHGHILECVKCHKQIILNYCPFESVNEDIKEKTGFSLEDENHILYGVCKDCQ
ncbi:MAG: transcriptional repressor [Bacilli bacterium]|nr:transcriptional repressor [Bacilli bacterium]